MTEGSKPTGPATVSPEYEAFRNLTERLVKVPKKNLDEARDRDTTAKR